MNDLHIELNYAVDCSKCRKMNRGNWSDSNSDSGAVG